MSKNRLPTDAEMRRLREAGAFICRCPVPAREELGLWAVDQCARCGKPVTDGPVQLRLIEDEGA